MPKATTDQAVATARAQEYAIAQTADFAGQLAAYAPNLAAALPRHVSVERFKRVLITAVSLNPDLLYANRRTLFTSAVKCAADGLVPDGREAALVTYNTEVKQRDPVTKLDTKIRIDAVQYLPMIFGIRKRMRNSGDVLSATAEVIYKNDKFRYSLGDNPFIEHEPPELGTDRGPPIGAYARIVLKSGEVLRDVMSVKEIEAAKSQARGADKSLMWTKFWWEAWKKTVLKRCAKTAPQSPDLEFLEHVDEEPLDELEHQVDPTALDRLPGPGGQMVNGEAIENQADPGAAAEETEEQTFAVVDADGQVFDFDKPQNAAAALDMVFRAAAGRGSKHLDGIRETNAATLQALREHGLTEAVDKLESYQALDPGSGSGPVLENATGAPPVSETPGGTVAAAESDQPNHGPAHAGAAASGSKYEITGQSGVTAVESDLVPERESKMIVPPAPNGKPEWRAYAVGLFLPKLRQQKTTADLAYFLADNDENLKKARAVLAPPTIADINEAIEQQWAAIDKAERKA